MGISAPDDRHIRLWELWVGTGCKVAAAEAVPESAAGLHAVCQGHELPGWICSGATVSSAWLPAAARPSEAARLYADSDGAVIQRLLSHADCAAPAGRQATYYISGSQKGGSGRLDGVCKLVEIIQVNEICGGHPRPFQGTLSATPPAELHAPSGQQGDFSTAITGWRTH